MEVEEASLSEKDERLLMRFIDGECGFLSRRKARQLLVQNEVARNFVRTLDDVRRELEARDESVTVDLWSHIERRIEQEEHTAVFLGERSRKKERPAVFSPAFLTWGTSGAAVAAGLLFFVFQTRSSPTALPTLTASSESAVENTTPRMLRDTSTLLVSPVSDFRTATNRRLVTVAPQLQEVPRRPRIIERGFGAPVEVDWVRSDGSVRMMQAPDGRTPIIWVQRKKPAPLYRRRARRVGNVVILEKEFEKEFQKERVSADQSAR